MGDPTTWLSLDLRGADGPAILIYVCLDGFDLGVGILFARADEAEKDRMIASIGPFWDANETWLVLSLGLLLVAFPAAHGTILSALYLPVAVMLIGLILRGVAFEFRAKARRPQGDGGTGCSSPARLCLAVPGLHAGALHHGPRNGPARLCCSPA